MEIVTKQYLENNLIAYDNYRGLGKIGQANGIATLDANGTLSSAQVPSNVVTTSSTSLMTAAEKTKLAGISDGATSTEVTEGDIESTDPNAYVVGTIKVDDAIIDLYGKDTTYQKAANNSLGLVMTGTNNIASGTLDPDNDWYPVAVDSAGHMYVNVPAQKTGKSILSGNTWITIGATGTGDTSNYSTITIQFPKTIYGVKLTYATWSSNRSGGEMHCKIAHKLVTSSAATISIDIPYSEKVIYKSGQRVTSFLYATICTLTNTYDAVIKVCLDGKSEPYLADIL